MNTSKIHVLLDNGHGSNTAGKRSPDGKLREYAYAREIVKYISASLKKLNIANTILVPETTDISLSTRVSRANTIYKKNKAKGITTILISVHCNAAGNGTQWMTARGWSVWTSVGQTAGDKLADKLYEAAEEVLTPLNQKLRKETYKDGDPDYESNFYILKHTSCPAALTENMFQDNKDDVNFLLSTEGKNAITKLHVLGITKYIQAYIK